MSPAERRHYQQLLEDRRRALLDAGPARIEPNRTDSDAVGVPDEDAQALSEMLQSLASSRNRESAKELQQIDSALRRLREAPDDFGLCDECGEDISDKRLELRPWATLCAECQGRLDPKRNQARRSVTDYR